jgi:hypothetical protein
VRPDNTSGKNAKTSRTPLTAVDRATRSSLPPARQPVYPERPSRGLATDPGGRGDSMVVNLRRWARAGRSGRRLHRVSTASGDLHDGRQVPRHRSRDESRGVDRRTDMTQASLHHRGLAGPCGLPASPPAFDRCQSVSEYTRARLRDKRQCGSVCPPRRRRGSINRPSKQVPSLRWDGAATPDGLRSHRVGRLAVGLTLRL